MIQRCKALYRPKAVKILICLFMILTIRPVGAVTYISVQMPDYIELSNHIWVDGQFSGQLSDTIEFSDGPHDIELFGPPNQPPWLMKEYYVLKIVVNVSGQQPTVQAAWFETYAQGSKSRTEQLLNPPVISRDINNGNCLEIRRANLPSNLSYNYIPAPGIARFSSLGVLRLLTTSIPTGAEVCAKGVCVRNTGSPINVPYRDEKKIGVTVKILGKNRCSWSFQAPFKNEEVLNCIPRTP